MESRYFNELASTQVPDYLRTSYPLYERKPVTDLWIALTSIAEKQLKWKNVPDKDDNKWLGWKARLMEVCGPPGSGKSSAVYAWGQKTCVSSGYSVAWINVATGMCWFMNPDENRGVTTTMMIDPNQVNASIVIFDGVRSNTLERWESKAKGLANSGVAVILVSSERVRLYGGDMNNMVCFEYRFPSWTMEEYQHACRNDTLWRNVANMAFGAAHIDDSGAARDVALEDKYPVSGHCARFMFTMSRVHVLQVLKKSADALQTLQSLRQAVTRHANEGAVNTLMAWLHGNGTTPEYTATILDNKVPAATTEVELTINDQEFQVTPEDHENCFVSSEAARTVISRIETDVSTLRTTGKRAGLRAVEGYALEASFSRTLQNAVSTASPFALYDENGDAEQWSATSYRSTRDIFDAVVANHGVGSWVWVGGYQAGFDAVHIFDTDKIRFTQVTAGKKHDFLLCSIRSLLEGLALQDIRFTHVDVVVVRPLDDDRDFSIGTVTGRLDQGWKDFSDNLWDTRDPSRNVRIRKIDWSI